ncbi:MAG: hypothetical protein DMD43_10065 [Gemmatimonadetes bacterium]|nr:MAG: hypothetical protein DMD43_10065 [Gemmatimonadota bacterium]
MTAEQPPAPPDSKQTLYEAARTAIDDRAAKDAAARLARTARSHPGRLGLLAAVAVAGALILILRPAWLAGPKGLPPEPPAIAVATVRLTLLRERERVLEFQRHHGRLPATLAEAGSPQSEIAYTPRHDARFSLAVEVGDSLIVLQSSDSVKAFLGGSIRTLAKRRAP